MVCKLFIILLVFVSCVSVPPVDERPSGGGVASIEAVQPVWRPFAREATGGLAYLEGKVTRPRLEFYALRVDISNPELEIVVAGGGRTGGKAEGVDGGSSLSVKVSTFVRENNLLAGINALPFDTSSAVEGEPRVNIGLVISGGVMISPPHPVYDALIFYTGGGAVIIAQSETGSDVNTTQPVAPPAAVSIENAVGGFRRILENGKPVERVADLNIRHPRSAVGISSDGRFLYLLVIDGRRPGSIGATEKETALLLLAFGASEGINFDGGGSSALALRFPDGKIRTVNTPVHGGIPGRERAVAGCLGVGIKTGNQYQH